ncbi:MAG: maleylpyruvate isomerase N-terminal domain-containing protein [Actinomycetota bacterium]|nr:maleylpyruvate isomerase N-terminal domain-containing protein [Actinomycetota bacterium]
MADRSFTHNEAVAAFGLASDCFLGAVRTIDDDQWELPGLGEWNVRELVAHTVRAFRTVDQYLDGTVRDPTPLASAAEYYRMVLAEDQPHIHIAVRARREAPDLGDDPIATAETLADQARRSGERAPAATPVHTFVGVIALADYLATRVVELVVHTLDLAAALGLDLVVPPAPARMAVQVLTDLVDDDYLGDLLLALTGRTDLLVGLNALA